MLSCSSRAIRERSASSAQIRRAYAVWSSRYLNLGLTAAFRRFDARTNRPTRAAQYQTRRRGDDIPLAFEGRTGGRPQPGHEKPRFRSRSCGPEIHDSRHGGRSVPPLRLCQITFAKKWAACRQTSTAGTCPADAEANRALLSPVLRAEPVRVSLCLASASKWRLSGSAARQARSRRQRPAFDQADTRAIPGCVGCSVAADLTERSTVRYSRNGARKKICGSACRPIRSAS